MFILFNLFNDKQDNIYTKKKHMDNCCVMIYANEPAVDECIETKKQKPVLKISFDSNECTYFVNNLVTDVKIEFTVCYKFLRHHSRDAFLIP